MKKSEKLYVYVDESWQDATSRFFVVVAVISRENQEHFRRQLKRIEHSSWIRLADMWAGCTRSALLHEAEAENLIKRAKKENYLYDLT